MFKLIPKTKYKKLMLLTSEDLSLLRQAEQEVISVHSCEELLLFEQATLDINAITDALSTVGFASCTRHVILRLSDVAKLNPEDFEHLTELFSLGGDDFVSVFAHFGDRFAKDGKQAVLLREFFEQNGAQQNLIPLVGEKLDKFITELAQQSGCTVAPDAVRLLGEKFSKDVLLLELEVSKCAALSGYADITVHHVTDISSTVLSADVFSLLSLLLNGKNGEFFKRLDILLQNGEEPIAILAALTASFIDIHRVSLGKRAGKGYTEVFKDFGYKGSNYRLKKADEMTRFVGGKKLSLIMNTLYQADRQLKSSSLDRGLLLERYCFALTKIIAE